MNRIYLLISFLILVHLRFQAQPIPPLAYSDSLQAIYHPKRITSTLEAKASFEEFDGLVIHEYEFDSTGRKTRQKEYTLIDVIVYDEETFYTYDSAHHVVFETEVQHDHPRTKSDSSLTDITGYEPDTSWWAYEYDGSGRKIKAIECLIKRNQPTEYHLWGYDNQGLLVEESIFPARHHATYRSGRDYTTYYTYNDQGLCMTEVTVDHLSGDTTSWKRNIYDEEGRLIELRGPYDWVQYHYDATHRLSQEETFSVKIEDGVINRDQDKELITYTYNAQGKLVHKVTQDPRSKAVKKDEKWTFDEAGNLLKSARDEGLRSEWIVTHTYHPNNLRASTTWYTRESVPGFTVWFAYELWE